jgi:hypothetical protein
MSEPPTKVGSKRRPSLASALAAAKRAGQTVRSATIDPNGGVTLTFGNEAPTESGEEWDRALRDRCDDKH